MNNGLKYLIYNTPEENVSDRSVVKDKIIGLTQKVMAELFGYPTGNIFRYLKNIFSDGELDKDSVTENISVAVTVIKDKVVYDEFNKTRMILFDFEKGINSLLKGGKVDD